jgi:hypothetical protein
LTSLWLRATLSSFLPLDLCPLFRVFMLDIIVGWLCGKLSHPLFGRLLFGLFKTRLKIDGLGIGRDGNVPIICITSALHDSGYIRIKVSTFFLYLLYPLLLPLKDLRRAGHLR